MRSLLKTVIFTALIGTASTAMAQDTSAVDELSMGQPTGPQVGQPYEREIFGDWALRCVRAEEGEADPCSLYQLLMNDEGVAVSEITMFPLGGDTRAAAAATIVVPLETLLTQQLTIAVDGNNARRYPFTFCNQAGCVARVGFTDQEVAEFKAGAGATLRLVPAAAPDQEVVLDLSLTGFTAGYTALEEGAPE